MRVFLCACARCGFPPPLQDGYTGDKRTLDKVIDGVNVTTDDLHMWMVPFTPNASHLLEIDLGDVKPVYGVSTTGVCVACGLFAGLVTHSSHPHPPLPST
jgi:hypothetical protein